MNAVVGSWSVPGSTSCSPAVSLLTVANRGIQRNQGTSTIMMR